MANRDQLLPLPVRLCQACAEVLDADGGAITLSYTDPSRVTLCATDEVAARLEDLQDVLGQGPGPDAYNSGETVVAELAGDDLAGPWLMLADAARAALGFAATVYAVPIRPEADLLGVLTLYQASPRGLALDLGSVEFLAAALGAALLRDPNSQTELSPGPWATRAQIHQATGVVVAQLGIAPDDALALLRAHAYAHDATLDAIAAEVMARRLDFDITDSNRNEDT
jgi:hypothetical protein